MLQIPNIKNVLKPMHKKTKQKKQQTYKHIWKN